MKRYQIIVLGVGGIGSAACFQVARRGAKILGIEQFNIGHNFGSTHGETRAIRKSYFEHPNYVPLLQRAYGLWESLEAESGLTILDKNGLVVFGDPSTSVVLNGSLASARQHGLALEELSQDAAAARFPLYRPSESHKAIFEKEAGFLHVERAWLTHVELAKKYGAEIHEQEKIIQYTSERDGIVVTTDRDRYFAEKLIITGGPWSTQLLSDIGQKLKLYRLIQYWFRASIEHDLANGTPCFAFHLKDDFYYGFPMLDKKTIKIASHFAKTPIATAAEREIKAPPSDQLKAVQQFIEQCLPKVSTSLDRFAPCIYTMTEDENFILDHHPEKSNVVFGAGFSGHGFKFAPVIGEILADLALDGKTSSPIEFLRLR